MARCTKPVSIIAVVVSLLVCGGCGIGAHDGFAPLTIFDNFRPIKDGQAYRSAQLDAESLELVLATYGIRTIINLRGENEDESWYQSQRSVADRAGVSHIDVRMSASTLPPRDELLKLYDTYLAAEYPILIHCKAGADRTGAAAAIWRMVILGESRREARRELSPLFGHFRSVYPEMDELVEIFEPSREWIEQRYLGN